MKQETKGGKENQGGTWYLIFYVKVVLSLQIGKVWEIKSIKVILFQQKSGSMLMLLLISVRKWALCQPCHTLAVCIPGIHSHRLE